jgi:hypothetical protein
MLDRKALAESKTVENPDSIDSDSDHDTGNEHTRPRSFVLVTLPATSPTREHVSGWKSGFPTTTPFTGAIWDWEI